MVKQHYNLFSIVFWAFILLGFQINTGKAQDCFKINSSLSKILLEPSSTAQLPVDKDTFSLPCIKSIVNFNFTIDFQIGVEPYFENVTQLAATLSYKSSTFILKYDNTNNTFSLPSNQPNLREGTYTLNISAMDCDPLSVLCNDCSFDYSFTVVYNNDSTLFISIETEPTPPVLTCFPGSNVKLIGTAPPHNGFTTQWSKLINNQFTDIPGATSFNYNTMEAGTYRYILSGPAGCTASNIISVNPPQMPEVYIEPDTQVLHACEQKIEGVNVKYFGGANNLDYKWTASNNGILISGANTMSPVIGAPGNYSLVVQRIDNGCTASASLTAVAGAIPVVTVQIERDPGDGFLDCRLKEISLQAKANQTPAGAPFTFNWSDGATGPDLQAIAPGLYAVTATSTQSGCKGTASILIRQDISIPAIQILSARDTICDDESIALTAQTEEPTNYQWSNGSTNNVNTVAPLVNGPNQYAVTVTANDNGCTNSAVKTIVQVDAPIVVCQQDNFSVPNGGLAGMNCSTTGDQISWVTNAVNVRNIPSSGTGLIAGQVFQLDNVQAPGYVEYAFYGINSGCTSKRVDVVVTVLPNAEDGIFIPELVTPNGDGLHDNWEIVVPETIQNPAAYQLLLFNRYGAKVYEGTLANTVPVDQLPDGSYYYAISKPGGGNIRGAVTVLRRQ